MPEPTVTAAAVATSASLDDLYWNCDLTVADVARRAGVAANQLHRHVASLDAGIECRLCAARLAYTSRSHLNAPRLRCRACGASRRNPRHPDARPLQRPAAVGGVIVVRRTGAGPWGDPGADIDDCIDALAAAGVAWDPDKLVVLPAEPGDGVDVAEQLAPLPPGVVALRDLRQLAGSQTQRLQVLFALTRMHWRVLVAHDISGLTATEIRARHLEQLDEHVDRRDPWSPTWSEHLVSLTSEPSRAHERWTH